MPTTIIIIIALQDESPIAVDSHILVSVRRARQWEVLAEAFDTTAALAVARERGREKERCYQRTTARHLVTLSSQIIGK